MLVVVHRAPCPSIRPWWHAALLISLDLGCKPADTPLTVVPSAAPSETRAADVRGVTEPVTLRLVEQGSRASAVACGSRFFVAWTEYGARPLNDYARRDQGPREGDKVRLAIIDATGDVVRTIDVAAWSGLTALACGGSRVLLAWTRGEEIHAVPISFDGKPLVEEPLVVPIHHLTSDLHVAFDGTDFVVGWGSVASVFTFRVRPNGTLGHPLERLAYPADSGTGLACRGATCLHVWLQNSNGTRDDHVFATLRRGDELVVPAGQVGAFDGIGIGAAAGAQGYLLTFWGGWLRVGPMGEPTGQGKVAIPAFQGRHSDLVAVHDGTGFALVAHPHEAGSGGPTGELWGTMLPDPAPRAKPTARNLGHSLTLEPEAAAPPPPAVVKVSLEGFAYDPVLATAPGLPMLLVYEYKPAKIVGWGAIMARLYPRGTFPSPP
jgi:hypothetical protein